jgi:beta-lactamase regulating signal transducer with metallopeptidase domain
MINPTVEEETSQNSSTINYSSVINTEISSINIQHQNQVPLMVISSLLGLLLLVVAIIAGIYISYRLCKRDKKIVRYNQEYINRSVQLS